MDYAEFTIRSAIILHAVTMPFVLIAAVLYICRRRGAGKRPVVTRFRVRPAESNQLIQWAIFDETEQPVYTGTYQQCEDWLDHHENNHQPRKIT